MSSVTMRLVLQALGHVTADDPLRETFDDGGLADAGLADEHGIVLRAARQHLDDAADLLVAADHRIELAAAGELGEVAAVLFERLVGAFRILARHALIAAHLLERGHEAVARQPGGLEELADGPRVVQQREQQMLDADEVVLQAFRFLFGLVELLPETRGEIDFTARSRNLRQPIELAVEPLAKRGDVGAGLREDGSGEAVRLLEQRGEQMLGLQRLVSPPLRERLRRSAGPLGIFP